MAYNSEPYNPKTIYRGRNTSSAFGAIRNPIAEEILDTDRVKMLYARYPIIPFFDDGDATLDFFSKIRRLAPTHAACIINIRKYVLGGGFLARKTRPLGFASIYKDEEPATKQETESFVEVVENICSLNEWVSLSELIYDNRKTYGNSFVEVVISEVMGKKVVKAYNHDAPTCRYLATSDDEPKMILISKLWTVEYLDRNPAKHVFAYPNFSVDELGTMRTIIHSKAEISGRPWYSEPDYIANLYFAFNEIQAGEYQTDAFARRFTGEVFFETASNMKYDSISESAGYELSDDEDDYFEDDNFEDALMQVFSNLGTERKSILYRRRGIADPPTVVHEFTKNQDAKYFDAILSIDERQIIKTHDWHSLLMGQPTPGKLGNSQEFSDIFRSKFWTVIKPWQEVVLRVLNQILKIAKEEAGVDTGGLEFGLVNLFKEMLEQDPTEKTNPNPNANPNTNTE